RGLPAHRHRAPARAPAARPQPAAAEGAGPARAAPGARAAAQPALRGSRRPDLRLGAVERHERDRGPARAARAPLAAAARGLPGMTREIEVELGARRYPVRIGRGLLADGAWAGLVRGRDVLVVSDGNVAPLYLARVEAALAAHRVARYVMPPGEQ